MESNEIHKRIAGYKKSIESFKASRITHPELSDQADDMIDYCEHLIQTEVFELQQIELVAKAEAARRKQRKIV